MAFPTPKGGDVYDGAVAFDKWLDKLAEEYELQDVVWERVDHVSFASAFAAHHRLLTTLVFWAKRHGLPYFGIPLSSHRHHAGVKSGDKVGAIEYARRRFEVPITTDDQGDAVCMAALVIDGGMIELPTQLEEAKKKKKEKTDAKRSATLARKKAEKEQQAREVGQA